MIIVIPVFVRFFNFVNKRTLCSWSSKIVGSSKIKYFGFFNRAQHNETKNLWAPERFFTREL